MLKRLSFAGQMPSDYAETKPSFDLRHHLCGPMKSEGIIYGPSGRVVSQFVADMEGIWEGDSGELHEVFHFASGNVDHRLWKINLTESGSYSATASDVVGHALGHVKGMAAQSRYKIKLGPEAGGHVLSAIDWMYLSANGVILNRTQFRKFGIKVGELFATIRPQ